MTKRLECGRLRLAWTLTFCALLAWVGSLVVCAPTQNAENSDGTGVAIGISVGTSNSRVCMMQNGEFGCLVKSHGDVMTSSSHGKPVVSAAHLKDLVNMAATHFNASVTDATITTPVRFDESQQEATKEAGMAAGLNVRRVLREPIAAAFAYGLDRVREEYYFIVYDLGAETVDVTLINAEYGVLEVIATASDVHLGGRDFNNRVIDHLAGQFNEKYNVDIGMDIHAMGKLRQEVEKAKKVLASESSTLMKIENFYESKDFEETLTRGQFEHLNEDLLAQTLKLVDQVIESAKVKKSDIDNVLLVGGSTRIVKVQSLIRKYFSDGIFHKGKAIISQSTDPEEDIGRGAAYLAAQFILWENELICTLTYDVCPLSLGIETSDGVMATLIRRNTVMPTRKSELFSTATDNQSSVLIRIFDGERYMAKDNRLLERFELTGIPPAPSGVPQISVTFELDANGLLSVSVGVNSSTRSISTNHLIAVSQFSYDEIDAVVLDVENHAEADWLAAQKDTLDYASRLKEQVMSKEEAGTVELDEAFRDSLFETIERITNLTWQKDFSGGVKLHMDARRKISNEAYSITQGLYGTPGAGNIEGGTSATKHDEL